MSVIAATLFLGLIAGFVYLLYSTDVEQNGKHSSETFICQDCNTEYRMSMEADDDMCEYCWLELMA